MKCSANTKISLLNGEISLLNNNTASTPSRKRLRLAESPQQCFLSSNDVLGDSVQKNNHSKLKSRENNEIEIALIDSEGAKIYVSKCLEIRAPRTPPTHFVSYLN